MGVEVPPGGVDQQPLPPRPIADRFQVTSPFLWSGTMPRQRLAARRCSATPVVTGQPAEPCEVCLPCRWMERWRSVGDSELEQQHLGSTYLPLSLRLTVSTPAEFEPRKGGLERHPEPLGGGEARPPGPMCSLRPAREVVKATGSQLGAGLADRESHAKARSAEWACGAARLVGSLSPDPRGSGSAWRVRNSTMAPPCLRAAHGAEAGPPGVGRMV
jgi:hypothetical protein